MVVSIVAGNCKLTEKLENLWSKGAFVIGTRTGLVCYQTYIVFTGRHAKIIEIGDVHARLDTIILFSGKSI
jgi:hypothetical protein